MNHKNNYFWKLKQDHFLNFLLASFKLIYLRYFDISGHNFNVVKIPGKVYFENKLDPSSSRSGKRKKHSFLS